MIASVDGYERGWVVVISKGWQSNEPPRLIECGDFASVLKATESCKVVVVDMPIGLPSGAEPRTCDLEAWNALGSAGRARLFLCPPRQSLDANKPEKFQALVRGLTGKGAGFPVWGIVRKIKQVDAVMTPDLQNRVMEFHPELAWKRLAGSVLASKHGAEGLLQRINLLNKQNSTWLTGLKADHLPSKVKLDDVLDSVAGLSVAHAIAGDSSYKNRFPKSDPPKDVRGLRMEIWF